MQSHLTDDDVENRLRASISESLHLLQEIEVRQAHVLDKRKPRSKRDSPTDMPLSPTVHTAEELSRSIEATLAEFRHGKTKSKEKPVKRPHTNIQRSTAASRAKSAKRTEPNPVSNPKPAPQPKKKEKKSVKMTQDIDGLVLTRNRLMEQARELIQREANLQAREEALERALEVPEKAEIRDASTQTDVQREQHQPAWVSSPAKAYLPNSFSKPTWVSSPSHPPKRRPVSSMHDFSLSRSGMKSGIMSDLTPSTSRRPVPTPTHAAPPPPRHRTPPHPSPHQSPHPDWAINAARIAAQVSQDITIIKPKREVQIHGPIPDIAPPPTPSSFLIASELLENTG